MRIGVPLKIAAIGDTHLGYPRFAEDSFAQAEAAFLDADSKADIILFLGDLFDTRIPNLSVLGRAAGMFRKLGRPVYAIHGNHERRSRGALNPVEFMERAGLVNYLHGGPGKTVEAAGEKIFLAGLGNVPDDLGKVALTKFMEGVEVPEGIFSALMLHQSFKEFVFGEDLLKLDDVDGLPFDLVLNGHIHSRKEALGGRFIVPGSTVITQLTKEETAPRGYVLYDTRAREHEFVPIPCREFLFEEMEFRDAPLEGVRKAAGAKIAELKEGRPEAILRLKLTGTLAKGLKPSDLALPSGHLTFVDNKLNERFLKSEIGEIRKLREERLSVRELAGKRLREKLSGRISLFDPDELFERLLEGPDAALEYLNRAKKG